MGFTNSKLVSHTKISPNKNVNRNHAIDTITIHCVVGQCSVESLGNHFANSSVGASANYGVGYDGKIGLYVEEKDRSWCTCSSSNDNRAVTIEVASDTKSPYAVTQKAYDALIKLVADICKRNNIKKLLWKGDKSLVGQITKQNMTVHRWFASTECPGSFLYSHMGDIANKVNALLQNGTTTTTTTTSKPATTTTTNTFKPYTVKVTVDALNIRKSHTTQSSVTGCIRDRGVYTIVQEAKGTGSAKGWGKLKSGLGWIALDYVKKV